MEPTLFDTSIYTVHTSQPIADYSVDVDYDPYLARFERRKGDEAETTEFLEDIPLTCNEGGDRKFLEDKSDCPIMGRAQISSRKTSDLQFLEDGTELLEISSRNKRRNKGQGSGCIYYRTVTKKGKDYSEAYYQYEFWFEGKCTVKSCKYIPKRLLKKVQQMDEEKVPVAEILQLLIRK